MATTSDRGEYKHGFWALIATQFQGAFSDNFFKQTLVFFLLATLIGQGASEAEELEVTSKIVAIATILFSLPYLLFPGLFGSISDRFSKQFVIRSTKVIEMAIMSIGGLALWFGNPQFLWIIFFLMATQSALFSPSKYGIIPEILPDSRISWGNGILEMTTVLAIIAGTGAAGFVYVLLDSLGAVPWASALLVVLAFAGYTTAGGITRPAPADPSRHFSMNPFTGLPRNFQLFWNDRWLGLSVLAYTYFWFAGALLWGNVIPFGQVTLAVGETGISVLLVALFTGIAAGAVFTGFVSRGKVEVGLIPLGALGMAVFCSLLGLLRVEFPGAAILLFCLGFSGGMFDVPLIATIQQRSPSKYRASILATTNMLTFAGIALAGTTMYFLGDNRVTPHSIFLISGAMSLAIGIYICFVLPIFVLRFFLWVLGNSIYRVRVVGRQNIPTEGGALLIANHTSFLDALIILSSIDRRVRFIMYQGVYEVPWIKPLAKMMGAIPVSPGGGPREVVNSLRTATEALKAGDLVCIFAEGQITRTGQLLPFRRGFERIMKGVEAPILPVYLDQVWGSIFSFSGGKFFWKWPARLPYPITVAYGAPMPSDSNAFELRSAILELGTDVFIARKLKEPVLHRRFVQRVRRNPFKRAIADTRSGELSNLKTLAGSIILARKIRATLKDDHMVGVYLPQSVGATLVNVALQLMGKVPVNLNYTASKEALEASAEQCDMKHVLTARAFLEMVPLAPPGEAIHVEDILKSVTKMDRVAALILALFCPIRRLEKRLGSVAVRQPGDLATIVFSSGSEGEPKGVMLTHYNISSNIESALEVFPYEKNDSIMGMLPFFHSFGFTATLWLPLTSDFGVVFHPNPLEARQIGELIQKHKCTILFSTSTFLHAFIRRCSARQLSSLRFIICGAEKLAPRVRDAFKEKFGIEPLEGYGTTECSPIVSLNVPDFRAPGFFQKGTKRGSIGQPIPGISVRIVDPETRKVLQNGEAGLLMVKGPNVMQGYLGRADKTSEVLREGWYETGDISTIDEDGFITITDRLARFSKIGGEMVSHTKIEDALHKVIDQSDRVLAVAGVPDESKGERLVVLHTLEDDEFDELVTKLDETGLPNLWVPKPRAFYKVDEIPILGTGKMDLKAVKHMARRLDIGE